MNKIERGIKVILFTLFAFSCQHNNIEDKQSITDFDAIGKMHNRGLDYVLNSLRESKLSGKKTATEVLYLSEKATMQFVKNEYPGLSRDKLEFLTNRFASLNATFTNRLKKSRSPGRTSEVATELYQDMMAEATPYLTTGQATYINEVLNVLVTQDYDINLLQASLTSIENQVYSLAVEEQPLVLSAISVGRSSAEYWVANSTYWEEEITQIVAVNGSGGQPIPRIKAPIRWGVVAGADVGGAVFMGTMLSPLFIAPFVGWAIWGGFTGAYSLLASAGTAIIYKVQYP